MHACLSNGFCSQVVFDKRVFGVGGIIRGSSEAVRSEPLLRLQLSSKLAAPAIHFSYVSLKHVLASSMSDCSDPDVSCSQGMKETYAAYVQLLQEYFLHPQALKSIAGPAPAAVSQLDGPAPRLMQSDVVVRTSLLVLVAAVLWFLLWQRWLLSRSVAFQAAFQQAC